MEPTQAIILRRCLELADGAEPQDYEDGICWDVAQQMPATSLDKVYDRLQDIFEAFGLDRAYPLGPHSRARGAGRGLWEGEEGKRRRALCKRIAQHLSES